MRTSDAKQIRRGILLAREVIARKRMTPRDLSRFGFAGAPRMDLWEFAYHREMSSAMWDGRLRPPGGHSQAR